MTRVVFLRTKRYPHPSGPKRLRGTVMPIEDDVAAAWAKAGLVELLDAAPEEPPGVLAHRPAVVLESYTVAQLRELAESHKVAITPAMRKSQLIAAINAAWDAALAPAAPSEDGGVNELTAPSDGEPGADDGASLTD